jgi:hypothetical protein
MQQKNNLVSRTHSRSRLMTNTGHWLVLQLRGPAGEARSRSLEEPRFSFSVKANPRAA